MGTFQKGMRILLWGVHRVSRKYHNHIHSTTSSLCMRNYFAHLAPTWAQASQATNPCRTFHSTVRGLEFQPTRQERRYTNTWPTWSDCHQKRPCRAKTRAKIIVSYTFHFFKAYRNRKYDLSKITGYARSLAFFVCLYVNT